MGKLYEQLYFHSKISTDYILYTDNILGSGNTVVNKAGILSIV